MDKTFSIKVLFGIYLLLMAGKVFAFSCNVDGGSSIGAGTTSVDWPPESPDNQYHLNK
ncbi:fimbrial adhesin [Escherichia coli]|nr:fimbrial adhesin [Escherichia coli]